MNLLKYIGALTSLFLIPSNQVVYLNIPGIQEEYNLLRCCIKSQTHYQKVVKDFQPFDHLLSDNHSQKVIV